MAIANQLSLSDFTGTIRDVKQRPAGGVPWLFITTVTAFTDTANGAAVTFDADGCIDTYTLATGSPFIALQPIQDENTTGNVTNSKPSPRSPTRYTQNFTVEVPAFGKDVLKLENILKGGECLVILEHTNCCEVYLHGLDKSQCEDPAVLQTQLQGITFGASGGTQFNTLTGDRVKTWSFDGISLCPAPLVNVSLTDLLAAKTNEV